MTNTSEKYEITQQGNLLGTGGPGGPGCQCGPDGEGCPGSQGGPGGILLRQNSQNLFFGLMLPECIQYQSGVSRKCKATLR